MKALLRADGSGGVQVTFSTPKRRSSKRDARGNVGIGVRNTVDLDLDASRSMHDDASTSGIGEHRNGLVVPLADGLATRDRSCRAQHLRRAVQRLRVGRSDQFAERVRCVEPMASTPSAVTLRKPAVSFEARGCGHRGGR